ncbi:hypothetical protein [Deinococcus sp. Marseille-Q6407]|uniref:hypothetical protein n=1 Tax=Deinococcus sp. Marseille-Q6407 TaxID=2969223 RepID=UPI0021C04E9A|nr:hypothetical protein [Deinococcus sp. Marseille-Q6407]
MTLSTDHDLLLAALRFQGGPQTPTLWPGQLPQAAPVPLPELAGLLGSIEEVTDPGDYSATLYFLPVPGHQSDELIRRINAGLEGAGWRVPQSRLPFRPSGFQASGAPHFPDQPQSSEPDPAPAHRLIHGGAGLGAFWDSREEAGQTFLQLALRAGLYHHLTWDEGKSPLPTLPPLTAPDGWTLENIGGSGNGHERASHASSMALLRGTGTLNDLYGHFAEQLDNFGWDEQGAAATEALAISQWQTPDGGLGLLTLAERGPGLWQAELTVTRLKDGDEPEHSWFSF